MKIYTECIPCFFSQAVQACSLVNLDRENTWNVLNRISGLVPGLRHETSPPAMARKIYAVIREFSGNADPYADLKRKSNDDALAIYDSLKGIVNNSADKLLRAVELAIAGNIIDFGANSAIDAKKEINRILTAEGIEAGMPDNNFFRYRRFRNSLKNSRKVLYLADNAGEIVFDRVLIEQIRTDFPELHITVAVRGTPVINDCTVTDAKAVGLDRLCRILPNGSDAPGTILELCSDEFKEAWEESDMIISKGQGNYETLSETSKKISFLLIAKCPVIARHVGSETGRMLLLNV